LRRVAPARLGGRTTGEVVPPAWAPCNPKKGGRRPQQAHMPLYRQPWRPTSWQLQDNGRAFPPNYLHTSWIDWLYWDVELEG
ncbi:MAG: HNH endonuclease, partial [Sphingopyxis sp.]|nr:HNH endonuclease [Sphingopyxis sp.]